MESHFDGEKFTRVSKKKQLKHNKQSIKVELDEKFNYATQVIRLKKGKLNLDVNSKVPSFIPSCEKEFNRKLIKIQRIIMIRNFLISPKIPKLKHFKAMMGIK